MNRNDPIVARIGSLVLAAGVLALLVYISGVIVVINSPGYNADSWMIDFTAFWGAARMALSGDAIAAFDITQLAAVQGAHELSSPTEMPWLYPPTFHALITPLGLLPFSVAWILFDVISLTLFILVMAPLTHPIPSGLTIVLAAPVVLLTLAIGNNSLLTSACMTAAIIALGVGRQRSAGLLIALMTLKPSLGLLVPVVLIAARQWRAIAWATVGTVVLAAIGAAIFGTNYWLRFFDQLGNASAMLASGSLPFERMITWYAFLRVAGLAHDLALIGQLAVTALVMFAVGALWARRSGQFDLRAAAFCFGLPLATPYAFYYELVFSLVGILFLLRARSAWPGAVWLLFVLLWITPGLGLFAASIVPVALLGAPLQTIALGITLWHGFRASADRDAATP